MKYGYARVSTPAQDAGGQVAELKAAGCEKILVEVASGAAGLKRPQLVKVLADLRAGDVLVVTRLDRLARSGRDALNTLATVASKGAAFRSLREVWADTTSAHGRLLVTIMVGLADFDREMILERTGEGLANAKARGVRLGRPPTLTGSQLRFAREARQAAPPMPYAKLCQVLGVSRSTLVRALKSPDHAPGAPPRQLDLEDALKAEPAGDPPG